MAVTVATRGAADHGALHAVAVDRPGVPAVVAAVRQGDGQAYGAIERLHKLMKYDFGDERLTKRGNAAFQARLDKTLLAMHLVLAYG
jgi:hypothetical protein